MRSRYLLSCLFAVFFVLTPAWASAQQPLPAEQQYAPGTPSFNTARQVALEYWHADPCHGNVSVVWGDLDVRINAIAKWQNPYSSYDHPQDNLNCTVTFNRHVPFDWNRFCTVFVHEFGHLNGRPHAPGLADVMNAYYTQPLAQCAAITDPTTVPAPQPVAVPPAAPPPVAPPPAAQPPAEKPAKHKPARHKPAKHKPGRRKPGHRKGDKRRRGGKHRQARRGSDLRWVPGRVVATRSVSFTRS